MNVTPTPLEPEILEPATFSHVPVLSRELIAGLAVRAGGHYLDATVGGGGHSRLILQAAPDVKLTALDRDAAAIAAAQTQLAEFGDRVQFLRSNFATYTPQNATFDGIIADLGVSSYQFDTAARGFSFRHEAPLDMRMDDRQSLTAAAAINTWDEKKLADIFFHYGEERFSRRIARRIVEKRPFHTTTELAAAIASAVPGAYRHGRIHPATRVFQALRIAINDELTSLENFLQLAPTWLKPGGSLIVISFHSLEDRIVKNAFRASELLQIITKKPLIAQTDELAQNPRSRSAKLRIATRRDGNG
ncbi:16S rRNA (cytosine(1402)-N(4))-methyltransferase RsmH [Chroococcidiopsis sp. CCNUC1]|jgi:16S rRNA (cytosine1402-N4)-methyltransferase|uniref:16S rRNA (cytosine(1402)-N(4))-methyltransferase RsmH n=1 Tax=Chroococcidiopsis sp. CCNUC1 TaxID=2653189 RepID=UPI000D06BB81|nr:16S rRNA (cytosine(1402)-N(4))-methyltransferase RsmH [Chroococcidiopsis sp. CCNUC1]PSB48081.1 16S rRNA (cytosine(1402)-N(4))-methyltransferase [Cyanosarcina cf. burmensis CCALA 770]URD50179.1 16S rRNA (cytosine(1402)-N(4))-methyltransferase RsmH [Chroococcidiopsis sp. CCNUC1]